MKYKNLSSQELYDKNAKIWRFMDFTKFVSLLKEESLYFSRVDKFNDPFEGSITLKDYERRKTFNEKHPSYIEFLQTRNKNMRRFTAANCWHINENESPAMWQLYTSINEGVAIQTTVRSLIDSMANYEDDPIQVAPIEYINYREFPKQHDSISLVRPFLYKCENFIHEQELRAIIVRLPKEKDSKGEERVNFESSQETIQNGIVVSANLEQLIHKIYVFPSSADWFKDLVQKIVDKFKLDRKVQKSNLCHDFPLN